MRLTVLLALFFVLGSAVVRADLRRQRSPRGTLGLEAEIVEGGFHQLIWDLVITESDGARHVLPGIRGDAFFATDAGSVVVVEASDNVAGQGRLRILDLGGEELATRRVDALTDPVLAPDGLRLAYRSASGVVVLDVRSLEETLHPVLDLFDVGHGGRLVGARLGEPHELYVADGRGGYLTYPLPLRPRKVEIAPGEDAVLLLTATLLVRIELPSGRPSLLHACAPGTELRDLEVDADSLIVEVRRHDGDRASGRSLRLSRSGGVLGASGWTTTALPADAVSHVPFGKIPWPLQPAGQHPIGNTYGEYQNYGGSPYLHPGVDILGEDLQPVYAVASGVVKAVLTTGGSLYWRVAIGDSDTTGTTEGYLYAHLEETSIAVSLGQRVRRGQYLGDLVPWPVTGFTHIHFARIQDTGPQWYGSWLNTGNPHVYMGPQTESAAPVFEPARLSYTFAFCANETSTYLDPAALTGAVDIVAHVGDPSASPWWCTVQELRYSIWPAGSPQNPVVLDKLAVDFDMDLDTYQGGPIDPFLVGLLYKDDLTCDTKGDYYDREFFHVVTNSNGDRIYDSTDALEAWNTGLVPDGDYVVEVTATDARGNRSTASMTVTVANGAP